MQAEEYNDNSIKSNYKEQILIAAEGVMVMAELFAGQIGCKTDRITDTHKWLKKYCDSWRADNKESELREIEKRVKKIGLNTLVTPWKLLDAY